MFSQASHATSPPLAFGNAVANIRSIIGPYTTHPATPTLHMAPYTPPMMEPQLRAVVYGVRTDEILCYSWLEEALLQNPCFHNSPT